MGPLLVLKNSQLNYYYYYIPSSYTQVSLFTIEGIAFNCRTNGMRHAMINIYIFTEKLQLFIFRVKSKNLIVVCLKLSLFL